MGDALRAIKIDESLQEALRSAPSLDPRSPAAYEQLVSFIYGSLKTESGVTRDKIKQILIEGVATAK